MTFSADSPIRLVGSPNKVCQKSCTSRARVATYAISSVSMNRTGGLSSGEKFLDPINFAYAAPNVLGGRSHACPTLEEITRGRSNNIACEGEERGELESFNYNCMDKPANLHPYVHKYIYILFLDILFAHDV